MDWPILPCEGDSGRVATPWEDSNTIRVIPLALALPRVVLMMSLGLSATATKSPEMSRNIASAPARAGSMLAGSARSAATARASCGTSAVVIFRDTAVTGSPAWVSSRTSVRPTFPVAPVTTIMPIP